MTIVLHIERVVIDEALLGSERAMTVGAAIEHELGRLLTAPGALVALRGLGSTASLAPTVLPAASHPRDPLGPRIASAAVRGLGVESKPAKRGRGVRR
jgi:hypothetical protein